MNHFTRMPLFDSDNVYRSFSGCLCVLLLCIQFLHAFLASHIPERTSEDIKIALWSHGIVPKLMKQPPKEAVEVVYGDRAVNFGNNFTASEIQNEPTYVTWPAEKDSLYTLILTGPDIPTHENPEDKECQHWIVGNIPGNDVFSGYNQTEYKGILSFYEYGCHRLIFMVYKQPNKQPITFTEERREKKIIGYMRAFFHFDKFAKKYELGEPIAINFFLVHILPFPYNLSYVASMEDGPSDKFQNNPLTSNGILSQIFHQYF